MESVALEMHAAFDFINRYKATLTITTMNRFLLFDPKPREDCYVFRQVGILLLGCT